MIKIAIVLLMFVTVISTPALSHASDTIFETSQLVVSDATGKLSKTN